MVLSVTTDVPFSDLESSICMVDPPVCHFALHVRTLELTRCDKSYNGESFVHVYDGGDEVRHVSPLIIVESNLTSS